MPKLQRMHFGKYHGQGNDFIVCRRKGLPANLPRLARAITDRYTGVGADGLLVVLPARNRSHDARVRFFNSDGSEAEMSGNGVRCVGAFLLSQSRIRKSLQIETPAGLKTLRLIRSGRGVWTFKVGMGAPILEPRRIPFRAGKLSGPVIGFPLKVLGRSLRVTVSSMGNPHCSTFVKNFESLDWKAIGSAIERHERFPNRTNVEFVKVVSRRQIEVRYWERGVGMTNSSGTGSCGATVASILNGLTERRVVVKTLAGNLEVEWPEGEEILLTGPAAEIGHGTYSYLS